MKMRLPLRQVFLLCAIVFCQRAALAQQPAVTPTGETMNPRCARIAASGPEFIPLAQACEYALSRTVLPSFVCEETVKRFTGPNGSKDWIATDVVTAEVTFEHGKGDRYARVAIDGHPIRQLAAPHSDAETFYYLNYRLNRGGSVSWGWLGDFGSDLLMVFSEDNHATFTNRGEIKVNGSTFLVFDFQVKKKGDLFSGGLTPGIQSGDRVVNTELQGLLWIDRETASLRRLVVHHTDIDPSFPATSNAGSTDYNFVVIPELGTFLLPTASERMGCERDWGCFRNTVSFRDCHKYAGKSRIVPIPSPPDSPK